MVKVIHEFSRHEVKMLSRKVRPARGKKTRVDLAEIEKLKDGENGGPCAIGTEEGGNSSMDLKTYLPQLKGKAVEDFKKELASMPARTLDAKIVKACIEEIEETNDIEYNEEVQGLETLWNSK